MIISQNSKNMILMTAALVTTSTFSMTASATILPMTASAYSGREAGGGHAVQVGNKTYLFDFFESGIENSVTIHDYTPDPVFKNKISAALDLDDGMANKISCKLNQIRSISKSVGDLMIKTLFEYQWQRIMPDLFRVYDVGKSPIKNDSGLRYPLIQAALRFDDQKVVYINREVWGSLPETHQIGLIFHEILFGIYSNRWHDLYSKGKHHANRVIMYGVSSRIKLSPDSAASRSFNSYLFSRAQDIATKDLLEARWKIFMKSASTDYTTIEVP